jgi:hypothetical protein
MLSWPPAKQVHKRYVFEKLVDNPVRFWFVMWGAVLAAVGAAFAHRPPRESVGALSILAHGM